MGKHILQAKDGANFVNRNYFFRKHSVRHFYLFLLAPCASEPTYL